MSETHHSITLHIVGITIQRGTARALNSPSFCGFSGYRLRVIDTVWVSPSSAVTVMV